jgi:hypothetical protein
VKAVVYHADASFAWGGAVGNLYKKLFERFRKQCKAHGMEVIHLTLEGQPGWGGINIHYSGLDPKNVVLNREECFTKFLETAEDDVYWFAEPDFKILRMWGPISGDCTMLYREGDDVPMNPAWRMATPKALPFFTKLRDELRAVKVRPGVGHDWHGDSEAFTKVWNEMGRPTKGTEYLGVKIEFRDYKHYIKGEPKFTRNYFGESKKILAEGGE